MKFAVVSSTYDYDNRSKLLKRGLKCMLEQTYTGFEHFIISDGPDNKIQEEVSRLKDDRFSYFCTPKKTGLWGHPQRQMGMGLGKQKNEDDLILHYNDDNILFPEALETINEVFENDSNLDFVTYGIRIIEANGRSTVLEGLHIKSGSIDCGQLVAKRKIWNQIGGWYRFEYASDGSLFEEIASIPDIKRKTINKVLMDHY